MFGSKWWIGIGVILGCVDAHGQAGRIDPTWVTGGGFDGPVLATSLQSDGKIIAGGGYEHFNGVARPSLARLNQNGSLDETFLPPHLGLVYALISDADLTIVGGASFTITRLLGDGGPDPSFTGPYNSAVWLAFDGNKNIFYSSSRRVWKLRPDGIPDFSFYSPSVYSWDAGIHALAVKTNGNIVLGGGFSFIRTRTNNYFRASIAEVNQFGEVSTNSFTYGLNSDVWALCTQPDQKVVAGGEFWGSVARYTADGQVDPTFAPPYIANWNGFPGWIRAMALQPDGKIIIGGQFVSLGGVYTPSIARLMPDGTLDTTFDPGTGPSSDVRSILVQPDGRIVVGGNFGLWNNVASSAIVRLLGETPVLQTERIHSDKIVASWPAAYTNWVLQGVKNEKKDDWQTIEEPPTVINEINYVTNRIGETGRFYRLVPQQ